MFTVTYVTVDNDVCMFMITWNANQQ